MNTVPLGEKSAMAFQPFNEMETHVGALTVPGSNVSVIVTLEDEPMLLVTETTPPAAGVIKTGSDVFAKECVDETGRSKMLTVGALLPDGADTGSDVSVHPMRRLVTTMAAITATERFILPPVRVRSVWEW